MKKELIGIIICILLTSVAVAPVINALTNEINEDSPIAVSKNVFSSNSAQYQVSESNRIVNEVNDITKLGHSNLVQFQPDWPPCSKRVQSGFGRISNVQIVWSTHEVPYYSFNCENVICQTYDDNWQWDHYTDGEKLYVSTGPIGIVTGKFMFILLGSCGYCD